MSACDFCDEFAGGINNAYARRYGGANRTVLQRSGFRVFPSLGQIVEGHLLIVPEEHCSALADIPTNQTAAFESLCRQVKCIVQDVYGSCILFEHGVRSSTAGGCGIVHAHMHAVPVAAQGVMKTLVRQFKCFRVGRIGDMRARPGAQASYLYFEGDRSNRCAFVVDHIPSQYLRKLVAESIGKHDWDWRACGRERELIATLKRLTPLFPQV